MSGDLSKTIAKTLGISLAGRTALLLAPTVVTKAAVGVGMAGYSLYRIIKNRKEIIRTNENNQLNDILLELEITKTNNLITDTRFDEKTQEIIREFLRKNNINFEYTGYRSLRNAIYNLDSVKKRGLADYLNNYLSKGIDVEERVKKARKKLNLAASTAATVGIGAKMGIDVANTINGIDPGLASGLLNGTVLSTWIESKTKTEWFASLSGGLGFIGAEVLEKLPVIGSIAENVFAAENVASFAAIGATGGLIASAGLGLASGIKQICTFAKNSKSANEFLKLDSEKYKNEDAIELRLIQQKLFTSTNQLELIVIDIVMGALRDENIILGYTPKSLKSLKSAISNLRGYNKKKAIDILNRVVDSLNNDDLVDMMYEAGKISIGLFTAGLAAMSVYDIIKGGVFLPEVSKHLFPNNNIYNPVDIPKDQNVALNPFNEQDKIDEASALNKEFQKSNYLEEHKTEVPIYDDKYYQERTGQNIFDEADLAVQNGRARLEGENIYQWFLRQVGLEIHRHNAAEYAIGQDIEDFGKKVLGMKVIHTYIPNTTEICNKLDTLSSEELLSFMRFVNNSAIPDNKMSCAIREILSSPKYVNNVSEYIEGFIKIQADHDFVIDLTRKLANGIIPFSIFAESLALSQKQKTDDAFSFNRK